MNKLKYFYITFFIFVLIPLIYYNNISSEDKSINPYIGKKVSILGDSISTYKGYVYIDSNDSEVRINIPITLNDIWWNKIAKSLNMEIGYSSSLSGSRVSSSISHNRGTNLGVDRSLSSNYRIKSLSKNGTPDVILFYGGTNDIPNEKLGKFDENSKLLKDTDLTSKTFDNFVDAYITSIKRIKYYYPNSELIMILPAYATSSHYSNSSLNKFNNEMIKICKYLNVKYVDLRKCISKDTINNYLYDGLHPNSMGMQKISDCTINTMGIDINKLNSYNKYLKNTID